MIFSHLTVYGNPAQAVSGLLNHSRFQSPIRSCTLTNNHGHTFVTCGLVDLPDFLGPLRHRCIHSTL